MRLLIVTRELAGDERYGLGKAVRRIAAELRNRGHRVDVLTAADWGDSDRAEANRTAARILRLGRWLGMPQLPAAALAERWVQSRRTLERLHLDGHDHVWFHDPWLAAAYLLRRALRPGWPKVRWGLSEHGLGSFAQAVLLDGLPLDRRSMRWLLAIERHVLRRAAFVLVPSGAACTHLARDLGLPGPESNWSILGYGRPSSPALSRIEARRALGWSDDDFHVLIVGRLSPVKRVDVVIDACVDAQRLVPRLQLTIVGGELRDDLASQARKLERTPISVTVDDPTDYLAAADVYVSACAVESYGLANLEALCAGLPLLVAAGGGAVDVLGNGAMLLSPDSAAFASALIAMAGDPELRRSQASAALKRADEHPTWPAVATQYEAIIQGDHGSTEAPSNP